MAKKNLAPSNETKWKKRHVRGKKKEMADETEKKKKLVGVGF